MTSAFLFTTWSMKPGSWCEKPLWSCRQTCEREQVVERGDRPAPRDAARHLQPLRVLVEHRVDDVDEGLVAVEEAVPAGQQVALEPALAEVLGEHLHHAPVRAEVLVGRQRLGDPGPCPSPRRRAPSRFEAVSSGPKSRNVVAVPRDHVAQEARRARASPRSSSSPGCGDVDGVVAEVGQDEVAQQLRRRSRAGSRSSAARRAGASAASSGTSAPPSSKSSSGR